MSAVDVILMFWIACYGYKAMQRQYAVQFVLTAATVVALAAALLYTPYLASNQFAAVEELAYEVALELSPAVQVTAMQGDGMEPADSYGPIYQYLMRKAGQIDHGKYQQALLDAANTMMVNLFCFGVIVIAVKVVLGLLARFYESRLTPVEAHHSWLGLALGLLDSVLVLMVFSGFLMPFLLVKLPGSVSAALQQSKLLGILVRIFYQMWPAVIG